MCQNLKAVLFVVEWNELTNLIKSPNDTREHNSFDITSQHDIICHTHTTHTQNYHTQKNSITPTTNINDIIKIITPYPQPPSSIPHNRTVSAVVEFDYTAKEQDELSLVKGAMLHNIKVQKGGWWEGTITATGRTGMFPDNFVKVLEPDAKNPVVLR